MRCVSNNDESTQESPFISCMAEMAEMHEMHEYTYGDGIEYAPTPVYELDAEDELVLKLSNAWSIAKERASEISTPGEMKYK